MSEERRLSKEELELWRWAMRQTNQLPRAGRGGRGVKHQKTADPLSSSALFPSPRLSIRPPVVVKHSRESAAPPHASQPRPAVPSSQLDPGLSKRLARGRRQIDAVLDLHGARQNEAYLRLSRFLEGAINRGNRTLLVITGKGSPQRSGPESSSGVLRRMVPEWLRQSPMAGYVSGFEPAHQRHGGSGAFYVVLRRNR